MKKKRETCKYCGKKIEPKTTRGEFCSDKCRVYWNRESKGQWVHKDDIPKPAETGYEYVQEQEEKMNQAAPEFKNAVERMFWEEKQKLLNKK